MKFRLGQRPQWSQEFAQNRALRDFAFLGLPWDICGIEIRVMTLRDYGVLSSIESAVLDGRPATPGEIAAFLWFLSPNYTDDQNKRVYWHSGAVVEMTAREAFLLRVASLPIREVNKALSEYMRFIFMDAPQGGGGGQRSRVSFICRLLDNFMHEYGWTEEQALSCPMPRIYQYVKAMEKGGAPSHDLAAHGAYLRYINSLPEEEREPIREKVRAGEEIEIPDEFK